MSVIKDPVKDGYATAFPTSLVRSEQSGSWNKHLVEKFLGTPSRIYSSPVLQQRPASNLHTKQYFSKKFFPMLPCFPLFWILDLFSCVMPVNFPLYGHVL